HRMPPEPGHRDRVVPGPATHVEQPRLAFGGTERLRQRADHRWRRVPGRVVGGRLTGVLEARRHHRTVSRSRPHPRVARTSDLWLLTAVMGRSEGWGMSA